MRPDNRSKKDPLDDHQRARSNFIKHLVQRNDFQLPDNNESLPAPPRRVIQFWDCTDTIPTDVKDCIESWKRTDSESFELLLFDKISAASFIREHLGSRYEKAFGRCYHPAMQSDFFRLCYIFKQGGCYIDVDDVYQGTEITHLFNDGKLKIQPLCYDISNDGMVSPSVFTNPDANTANWIFYFNNNPLIAGKNHPLLALALESATVNLEQCGEGQLPEIQSTTGPGNLTKTVFESLSEMPGLERSLHILHDWENIAESKWPLSYREDSRNWRLSNQQAYGGKQCEEQK
jgi:mannosyltransferase OCH1-like enzyme